MVSTSIRPMKAEHRADKCITPLTETRGGVLMISFSVSGRLPTDDRFSTGSFWTNSSKRLGVAKHVLVFYIYFVN